MPEVTKETITASATSDDAVVERPARQDATSFQRTSYLVYFVFGLLAILLAFRFALKLLGANPSTGFVDFIYTLSGVFVAPFTGIFNTSVAEGAVTSSVFEPATLVAFVVYVVVAWGIISLIQVLSGRRQDV